MIFKYKQFLNEKISDKLSGFNQKQLKNQLMNNKIDLDKYLHLCNKYSIELPNDEEIKEYLLYNQNNDINIKLFIRALKKYDLNLPDVKLIKPYVLNGNITIEFYKKYYGDLTNDEIYQSISNYKSRQYDTQNDMLIDASKYNYFDLFKKSFKYKVDKYSLQVALFNAIENGNFEMVKYLVDYGADVNSYYEIKTMLYYAIINKNYDIVKYLIDNNAKIYYQYLMLDTTDEINKLLKQSYKP